ncbi:CapA family protein [Pelotomaculum isophthalicicum JI]|uniref:CapA family protein n=1 Tax=Pelotomaculum isophthalicicum JI TaxID=947010 RepID=A0A9X4H3H1_9FIRM|nr:CapA family protein [Pelotomaculum isophthalicicum]MDF9409630.1 CapA family protein [Pelotomaculum isophthalicicum JI]
MIFTLFAAIGCLWFIFLVGDLWPGTLGSCSPEAGFIVFKEKKLKLPAKQDPVCLIAAGDIMLSRGVARESGRHGDLRHPFLKIEKYLKNCDIVFGNLENPITPGREIAAPEMILRADPGVEVALKDAGFSILSLANNHLPDFGTQGLQDTLQCLDRAGVGHTGAGKTENEAYAAQFIEVKGMKLAFLAFTDPGLVPESYLAGVEHPGVAFLDREKVRAALQDAREKADFVVASIHAGTEYEPEPDQTQIQYAHLAIDAGADLVLGHHPHVVQKVEKYKGKYIFYSLGNFIFDQKWSPATREGLLAKMYITSKGVEKFEFIPVFINDQYQPQVLDGDEAKLVLDTLKLKLEKTAVPVWDQENRVFREGIRYVFYPQGPIPDSRLVKKQSFDLNQDGINEDYYLQDGELKVISDSLTIWQSPDNWWVDDFFLGDSNNDGISELNLLVWKSGSFGAHKPFWISQNDNSVKNHLFIFKLAGSSFKPVWQSSNLDRPNYETILEDLDGDGDNELIVTEGNYTNPGEREVSIWRWNGWGVSRISYGEPQDS